MIALRVFLQLVILSAGGVVFIALASQSEPHYVAMIVILGLFGFLFALTLVLKENTAKRLLPSYQPSLKPIGIALFLLGIFGVFYGASFFIDHQALSNEGGGCRAICGLILLTSQLFGETVARFVAFGLWTGLGLFLCFIGYKIGRVKEV